MAAMADETEDRPLDTLRVTAGVTHAINRVEDAIYLVAEDAGAVRACLMITFEWSDWRAGRFWWIQSVFVESGFRRQGLYTALHAEVRRLAQCDPLACGIRLYVEMDNTGAQATYRHLGMHETGYRLFEEEFNGQ
jgi:ribosomal protein S18 acetylase RimI-like enzyme